VSFTLENTGIENTEINKLNTRFRKSKQCKIQQNKMDEDYPAGPENSPE